MYISPTEYEKMLRQLRKDMNEYKEEAELEKRKRQYVEQDLQDLKRKAALYNNEDYEGRIFESKMND